MGFRCCHVRSEDAGCEGSCCSREGSFCASMPRGPWHENPRCRARTPSMVICPISWSGFGLKQSRSGRSHIWRKSGHELCHVFKLEAINMHSARWLNVCLKACMLPFCVGCRRRLLHSKAHRRSGRHTALRSWTACSALDHYWFIRFAKAN